MTDKPATLSAGQLAAEWDAKWKRGVAYDRCKIDANLAGVYYIIGIEPFGKMFDAKLDNGVLIRVTDTYEFKVNWLTPANPPQTDTPAGEGKDKLDRLEAHWMGTGDLFQAINNIVDDLSSGNMAAVDEAIEVLQVMAHRERRHQARNADLQRERDELRNEITFLEGKKSGAEKRIVEYWNEIVDLRKQSNDSYQELEARRQILDSAVALKERLVPHKTGNGWIDSIRFIGEGIEDLRARAEGAETEVREILRALKSHCKDDFVVVQDGAISWDRTIDEFVSFVTLPLHDKYAHEGGKPQIMTTDILKKWIASIDIPIMTDIFQTAVPNVFYATFALPLYPEHKQQMGALNLEVTEPIGSLRNRYMLKWLTPPNDEV